MDAVAVIVAPHPSVQHCVCLELTPYSSDVSGSAFELERCSPWHNAETAHGGKGADQFVGESIAVVLAVTAYAQVGEREYKKRSDRHRCPATCPDHGSHYACCNEHESDRRIAFSGLPPRRIWRFDLLDDDMFACTLLRRYSHQVRVSRCTEPMNQYPRFGTVST